MEDDLENVPVGELLHRADHGDARAQSAIEKFGADMAMIGEDFRAGMESKFGGIAGLTQPAIDTSALEEAGEHAAAEKRAAVEREEAMIRELAAMRQAVERADGRAYAAEGREREALDVARRNFWVAVVAVVVAIVVPLVT